MVTVAVPVLVASGDNEEDLGLVIDVGELSGVCAKEVVAAAAKSATMVVRKERMLDGFARWKYLRERDTSGAT